MFILRLFMQYPQLIFFRSHHSIVVVEPLNDQAEIEVWDWCAKCAEPLEHWSFSPLQLVAIAFHEMHLRCLAAAAGCFLQIYEPSWQRELQEISKECHIVFLLPLQQPSAGLYPLLHLLLYTDSSKCCSIWLYSLKYADVICFVRKRESTKLGILKYILLIVRLLSQTNFIIQKLKAASTTVTI